MNNYAIHIQKHDVFGKQRFAVTVSDKEDVLEVISMLEKNSQVKEYRITLIHDFGIIPVRCLKEEFNYGLISDKFQGISLYTAEPWEKKVPEKTEYWRYTNPITAVVTDYRFSEPLSRRQAVHLLMLVEPKFIASVKPEMITVFLMSLVEPWYPNEKLDTFDIKEWKTALGIEK